MLKNSTIVFVFLILFFAGAIAWRYSQTPVLEANIQKQTLNTKININIATQDYLQLLPGIGPAMSKRIVSTRKRIDGFHSDKDILKIKGIGEVTLNKIKPFIEY